ncbi:MAG: hypothetical protein AAGA75_14745 [Cyanobacteria bacterium P01_E01_bin.6]
MTAINVRFTKLVLASFPVRLQHISLQYLEQEAVHQAVRKVVELA